MIKDQLLIVDGYNMIGAWPELVKLKQKDELEEARDQLLQKLSEYASYKQIEVVVVFDAQFVPGITQVYEQYNLQVVFTATEETADSFIEAYAYQRMNLTTQVTVATSDLAEQWQIFSAGAIRKPAMELYKDLVKFKQKINKMTDDYKWQQFRRKSPWNNEQLAKLKDLLEKMQSNS